MADKYFKITLDDGITPLTLTNNPAGMTDFEVTYKRHEVYGTVFRTIGGNLRFVKEGKEYLSDLFFSDGMDAECSILIESIVNENKTYTTEFDGIIDFSNFNEEIDYLEVGTIDNSVMGKFLAREEIPFNILSLTDIDGSNISTFPTPKNITLTPVNPIYSSTGDGVLVVDIPSSYPIINIKDYNYDFATKTNTIGPDFNENTFKIIIGQPF